MGKWTLFFYGSEYLKGVGVGIVLIYTQYGIISMAYKLNFECTNSMAKYEALILGLKVAMNIRNLQVYDYSQLFV